MQRKPPSLLANAVIVSMAALPKDALNSTVPDSPDAISFASSLFINKPGCWKKWFYSHYWLYLIIFWSTCRFFIALLPFNKISIVHSHGHPRAKKNTAWFSKLLGQFKQVVSWCFFIKSKHCFTVLSLGGMSNQNFAIYALHVNASFILFLIASSTASMDTVFLPGLCSLQKRKREKGKLRIKAHTDGHRLQRPYYSPRSISSLNFLKSSNRSVASLYNNPGSISSYWWTIKFLNLLVQQRQFSLNHTIITHGRPPVDICAVQRKKLQRVG